MKLCWNDKPNNNDKLNSDDYIVVNYDDAEGNAKEFFLPVKILIVAGKVIIKFPSHKLGYYQFKADVHKYIDAEKSYGLEYAAFTQHIKNLNFKGAKILGESIQIKEVYILSDN